MDVCKKRHPGDPGTKRYIKEYGGAELRLAVKSAGGKGRHAAIFSAMKQKTSVSCAGLCGKMQKLANRNRQNSVYYLKIQNSV